MNKKTLNTVVLVILTIALNASVTAQQKETKSEDSPWDWSYALRSSALLQELELSNDQLRDLRTMYQQEEKMRTEMSNQLQAQRSDEIEPLSEVEVQKKWREVDKKFSSALKTRTREILLPFQIARLEQLCFWSRINVVGFAEGLTNEPASKILEIDRSQAKKINAKAEKLQEEFEQDLFMLRKKYRQKLDQSLTEEQQALVRKKLGEDSKIRFAYFKF